ncbi:MAG: substrate-binding domain-containing protein, partial [Planctomycetaceae bacterium]|nr:substrate-binding domain-containing protein [Planctomycetaceae bacterium]
PGVRVDVQTGGSSRGIADARSGLADLGMASRSLKDDEAELLAFPIATDGVCLIGAQVKSLGLPNRPPPLVSPAPRPPLSGPFR